MKNLTVISVAVVAFVVIGFYIYRKASKPVKKVQNIEVESLKQTPLVVTENRPSKLVESKITDLDQENRPSYETVESVTTNPTQSNLPIILQKVAVSPEREDLPQIQKVLKSLTPKNIQIEYLKMGKLSKNPELLKYFNGTFVGRMRSNDEAKENRLMQNSTENKIKLAFDFSVDGDVLGGTYDIKVEDIHSVPVTAAKGRGAIDFIKFSQNQGVVFDDASGKSTCYYQIIPSKDQNSLSGQYYCKDGDDYRPLAYFYASKLETNEVVNAN